MKIHRLFTRRLAWVSKAAACLLWLLLSYAPSGRAESGAWKLGYWCSHDNPGQCVEKLARIDSLENQATKLLRYEGNYWQVEYWMRRGLLDAVVVSPAIAALLNADPRFRIVAVADESASKMKDCDIPREQMDRVLDSILRTANSPDEKPVLEYRLLAPSHLSTSDFVQPLLEVNRWLQSRFSGENTFALEQRRLFWQYYIASFSFTDLHSGHKGTDCPSGNYVTAWTSAQDAQLHADYLVIRRASESTIGALVPNSRWQLLDDAHRNQLEAFSRELHRFIGLPGNEIWVSQYLDGKYRFALDDLSRVLLRQLTKRDPQTWRSPGLALSLGGGGVKSIFQAQVLDQLMFPSCAGNAGPSPALHIGAVEAGGTVDASRLPVSTIAGTSGGALTAVMLWLRPENSSKRLTDLWVRPGDIESRAWVISDRNLFSWFDALRWLSFYLIVVACWVGFSWRHRPKLPYSGISLQLDSVVTFALAVCLLLTPQMIKRKNFDIVPAEGFVYGVTALFIVAAILQNCSSNGPDGQWWRATCERWLGRRISAGKLRDWLLNHCEGVWLGLISGVGFLAYRSVDWIVADLCRTNCGGAANIACSAVVCCAGLLLLLPRFPRISSAWRSARLGWMALPVGAAVILSIAEIPEVQTGDAWAGKVALIGLCLMAVAGSWSRGIDASGSALSAFRHLLVAGAVAIVIHSALIFALGLHDFAPLQSSWLEITTSFRNQTLLFIVIVILAIRFSSWGRQLSAATQTRLDCLGRPVRAVSLGVVLCGLALLHWNYRVAPALYGSENARGFYMEQLVQYLGTAAPTPTRSRLLLTTAVLGARATTDSDPLPQVLREDHIWWWFEKFATTGTTGELFGQMLKTKIDSEFLSELPGLTDAFRSGKCASDNPQGADLLRVLCVAFASGSAFPVLAPMRIPNVRITGEPNRTFELDLMDGGYAHNQPMDVLPALGSKVVLVIKPTPNCADPTGSPRKTGALRYYAPRVTSMLYEGSQALDERASRKMTVATVEPMCRPNGEAFPFLLDFRRDTVLRLYREGKAAIDRRLPIGYIGRWGEPMARPEQTPSIGELLSLGARVVKRVWQEFSIFSWDRIVVSGRTPGV